MTLPKTLPKTLPAKHRGRRRNDKLLTLDRALLVLAVSVGMWAGVQATRVENQTDKITAAEKRVQDLDARQGRTELEIVREVATVKQEVRDMNRRVENIEKGVSALATSTARAVNRMQEQDERDDH